jgi:transposase-like protein
MKKRQKKMSRNLRSKESLNQRIKNKMESEFRIEKGMKASIIGKENTKDESIMFCPKCESTNINISGAGMSLYKCNDCGYEAASFPEKTLGKKYKTKKKK